MPSQSEQDKGRADWRASFREASPYVGLGMQLALSMAFFTIGGYLLDQALGMLPWLTVAGGFLGMTAVFIQLIRVSREMTRAAKSKRRKDEIQRGEDDA